jgi:Ni,Fe-hydrogenase maturation factor
MEKKILVFGNLLVKKDSLPLRLMKRLQEELPSIDFKEFDAVEDLYQEGKDLNILDTVQGIKKVELITDIDIFITDKIYSLHDFDLGYTLKLMKKIDMIDKVKIFGIPMNMNEEEAFEQTKKLITSILSSEND